jgi:hypothetical protein
MPGNQGQSGSKIPMGYGNTGIGWYCNSRGHPRYHFKLNAMLSQKQCLFPAPTENKRIAAFEPYHHFAFPGLIYQQLVDSFLGQCMVTGSFTHIDFLRLPGYIFYQLRIGQTIKNNHLSLLQAFYPFNSKKPGIPGSCAHQINYATLIHSIVHPSA